MEKGSQSTKDKAARNLMILDIGYTWICPASHHRITCPPTVTARYHHLGPASVPTVNRFTCQAPCYKYTVLMNQKISVLLVGGGAYSIIEQVRFISWPAVIMSIEPSCLSHSRFRFVFFSSLIFCSFLIQVSSLACSDLDVSTTVRLTGKISAAKCVHEDINIKP